MKNLVDFYKNKYFLQRVRLNAQGYDSSGRYCGIGKPLYAYESAETYETRYVRSDSRAEAKDLIRMEVPEARFFR